MVLDEKKRELVISHKSRTRCCCAYCGAPSEHETGTCMVTMQYGDERAWKSRLSIRHREIVSR